MQARRPPCSLPLCPSPCRRGRVLAIEGSNHEDGEVREARDGGDNRGGDTVRDPVHRRDFVFHLRELHEQPVRQEPGRDGEQQTERERGEPRSHDAARAQRGHRVLRQQHLRREHEHDRRVRHLLHWGNAALRRGRAPGGRRLREHHATALDPPERGEGLAEDRHRLPLRRWDD